MHCAEAACNWTLSGCGCGCGRFTAYYLISLPHLCLSFGTLRTLFSTVFSMLPSSSSDDRGRGGGGPPSRRGNGAGDHRSFPRPLIDRASVPRGICSVYWTTGACNFGFDCRFKHEPNPQVVVESSSPSEPTDYTPYFFTAEGLAVNSGSVIDPRHTLSPGEVHNYLKPYLADNFSFRDAVNVEGFSRILASVNSRNRAWVRHKNN